MCVSQSLKGIFWLTLIIKFKYVTTIKFSELIFCQKIHFINYITHILDRVAILYVTIDVFSP